ncbi:MULTISPECIES: cell wall metabolism sensor histidine kinase WalK [unclassified Arthrobacter]|uniref:sensor histidine kinase n=1 Tax=unclassified Arthrobacter TaxID=235627 RepID=UPI002785709B|nr:MULTISPECIES: HAMP domain-containing sensor histidine kinase [unclassified Arthrobacter]MDQ0821208.1 signal transduction histidine kinase [Arthrobacter sp. V1I7]
MQQVPSDSRGGGSRRRRNRWGVRKRSTAAAVAVVAMALVAGGLVLLALLETTLTASTESAARQKTQDVIAQLVVDQDLEDASEYIKATGYAGQYVQLLDAAGTIIAGSEPRAVGQPLSGLRPEPGFTLFQRVTSLPNIGNDDDFHVVVTGALVGRDKVFVVVASSVQLQADTVATVARLMLWTAPLLLVVVAVSVWLLVGRSLRQVEKIRGQVARINAERLDGRVDVPPTRDELEALALTMNTMLERLQASDREQRQFVSDASHELRSPLATLSAGVEIAAADPSGSMWLQLKDDLADETARMRYLVDDLLALARTNDGGLTREDADVDLDDVVDQEVRRLRAISRHKVIADLTPVKITGDARRLAQVLRNVLDNAERHALSRIRISLHASGDWAVVAVDDDGDPIPEKDRERVFERFVRLDESRSREGGGSGLGLAIAAGIMAAHHGSIRATETPAGECRFEMIFPLAQPSAEAPVTRAVVARPRT